MKTLSLALKKLRAMSGGVAVLIGILIVAYSMFALVFTALNAKAHTALEIALVDNEGSNVSKEFIAALSSNSNGAVNIIECNSLAEADALMDRGKVEGIISLSERFSVDLAENNGGITFKPSPSSNGSQAAKEFISGEAIALQCRLKTPQYAKELIGKELTEDELADADAVFTEKLADLGIPAEIITVGENSRAAQSVLGAFVPRYAGFTSFVIMLVLLLLGAFTGSDEARSVEMRMRTLRGGLALSRRSDCTALILSGIALLALSYAAKRTVPGAWEALCGFVYLLLCASLALALGRMSASARANITMPLIAFITSLAGGCFADLSSLGKLKTLSLFTPQGQYLSALSGESAWKHILIMLLASAALLCAAYCMGGKRRKG